MKRTLRISCTLALLLASLSAVPANAALQARGATSLLNGYPFWYQDTNGLALSLCLDQTPIGGVPGPTACVLEPDFDPDPAAAPFRTPVNGPLLPITQDKAVTPIGPNTFPGESFYFMASSPPGLVSPGGVISLILYEAAIEAGFANLVVDGGQAVFTRIRVRANVTVPGTYTITHPYGVETIVVGAIVPGPEINFTSDVPGLVAEAAVPGAFNLAVTTAAAPGVPVVGPTFLTNANPLTPFFIHPVTGDRYIGDNATPVLVQGGVGGVNSVTITGPTDTLTFNTFVLMGKVIGIEISPPAAGNNFGVFKLANASPARIYTVTNFTGLPATIAPLVSSNPVFTLTPAADTCSNALLNAVAPGNTCTFEVVFTPVADGVATSTLTVSTANAPNATVNVSGTGDGIAPVVAVTGISRFTKAADQTISGTVTDLNGVPATGVQVSVDGALPVAATVTGSTWTFPVAGLAANLPHTIAVTANDNALPAPGNLATPVNDTITVDTILPAVAVTEPAAGIFTKATAPLTFTVTDTNPAITVVKVDAAIVTPTPATLGPLADGAHAVTVETTDAAGNVTTVTNAFTVDGTPPVVTLVSPAVHPVKSTFGVTSPVLTFPITDVNPDPTKTTATLDGIPVTAGSILGPFTVGVPHTLAISVTDLAGNVTTATKTFGLLFTDGAMTSLGATDPVVGDALLALRVSVGLDTTVAPGSDTFKHGDVAPLLNGVPAPDGAIDIGDALLILRKAVGLATF